MNPLRPVPSDSELAILTYIYDRPEVAHSIRSLSSAGQGGSLPMEQNTTSLRGVLDTAARDALRNDIEVLVARGLVRAIPYGKGKTDYSRITLTSTGERQAIVAKLPCPARRVDPVLASAHFD